MLGILPSSFPSSLGLLSWREGPWWQKWSRWDNWNFSRSSCCLIRWPTTFLDTFTRLCGWLVLIYCCSREGSINFTTSNIYIEIYKPLCGLKGLVRRVAWPSAVLFECGLFCSGSLSCWFLWVVNEAAFGSVFALGGGGRLGREGRALLQNNNQKDVSDCWVLHDSSLAWLTCSGMNQLNVISPSVFPWRPHHWKDLVTIASQVKY